MAHPLTVTRVSVNTTETKPRHTSFRRHRVRLLQTVQDLWDMYDTFPILTPFLFTLAFNHKWYFADSLTDRVYIKPFKYTILPAQAEAEFPVFLAFLELRYYTVYQCHIPYKFWSTGLILGPRIPLKNNNARNPYAGWFHQPVWNNWGSNAVPLVVRV
ncbi:hypothetical protein BDQ17DRAFT_1329847 [Cyathus striatus]|nr:hypothetical protein BDQ17DRAFT_1329847 [Cyathus striatus]